LQREWAQPRNTTWFQLTRPGPLRRHADLRKALSLTQTLNCDQKTVMCDYYAGDTDWIKISHG